MYLRHFALTRLPFETPAHTDELFESNARREAEARLHHLIELRGIGLLSGEVGSGKTTACRHVTCLRSSTTSPSSSTHNTSLTSDATTTNSAIAPTSSTRAMTGSSTSSTATTWRSESPAAPASADHSRPRSPRRARCRTLPHHDRRDHRDHRGAGARVRSLRAVSALRQWGDSVRNRAPLDQKQSEKSVTKLRAMQHGARRMVESAFIINGKLEYPLVH